MRVIKPSRLQEYWTEHAKAKSPLEKWLTVARRAVWKSFSAVRQSFRHADEVRVESGRTVVVFNIGGNNYRLICAIHYNAKKVFVLRFMTHAEYSRNQWKETL